MSDEWRDFVRETTGRKRKEPPPRPQPAAQPAAQPKPKPKAAPAGGQRGEPTEGLGKRIQDEARVVPLDKLKKGGTKFVRVISPDTIVRIVGESLENALAEHSFLLDEDERKLIAKEARVGFSQLLIQHKQLQAERVELQDKLAEEVKARDKQQEELEQQVNRLREQLESDQTRLERERERAEGVRIAPASMDELERRLEGCARRLVEEGQLGLPGEGDPVPGLATFREQFAGAVAEVLRAERKRFGASAESQEAIELLERRVAKLSRALQEKEGDLNVLTGDELRAGESYYEGSGGLSAEAKRFDWKAHLLRRMTLQTRELLGHEVTDAEREEPFPRRSDFRPKQGDGKKSKA
ncbi:MAG: hypothetical protein KDD82_12450 [Planctomycetes bacterium]|nr:hypothetical protein [Planctomycetota bacterium]